MLRYYYDIKLKDRFDELFTGLYVHAHPTPMQGKYFVLTFDFSTVATDGSKEKMEESFNRNVYSSCASFAYRYRALHPRLEELSRYLDSRRGEQALVPGADWVTMVLEATESASLKIFLLIDEYDSFAHTLLTREALQLKEEMRNDPARARRGFPLYTEAFMGTGFVKNFYKAMKKFSGFCLDRAFITGVTPIVLDDMASGFNVISHLTLLPQFHALAGLTHADVALAVEQFSAAFPECGTREVILQELLDNYDHYRFNQHVEETLFNPDMVFYYFQQLASLKMPPEDLLDNNCRTDYDKLRLVAQPPELDDDTYLESLFDLVQTGRTTGRLLTSFSAYHVHSAMTLPSLLFYMGLLTLEGEETDGVRFIIPNRVIKQMHWQELYELLLRQKGITVHIPNVLSCLGQMSWNGELQPLVNLVQKHVLDILSSQDLKYMSEEVVKVLFAGYIVLGDVFNVISEPELTSGGYCDLFLGLDRRYPKARWGWILEFKYVKQRASQAVIQAKQKEAREQLLRYCEEGPRLRQLLGRESYKAASIVCVGLKKCVVEVVKVVDPAADGV